MNPAARLPLSAGRIAALFSILLIAACASEPVAPPQAPAPEIVTPPPAAPVTEAPPPAPVPRFAGHVASYKTLAEAEAAWPRLAERFPVMRETAHRYIEVDLGGQRGKVVRLLLGGFADQAGALAYCRTLRSSGLYCAPHDLPQNQPA